MDINKVIEKMRLRPGSEKIGMIATHIGVVRGNSLDGREVSGVEVAYDHEVLEEITNNSRSLPGIIDVMVEVNEGALKVGDMIMFVAVGGDIRDHVFPVLINTVDRIKKEAGIKKEFYK